jgi:hypothetical protein
MISQNYKRIAIYLFCLYKKTKMTLKKFNKAKIHLKFRKKMVEEGVVGPPPMSMGWFGLSPLSTSFFLK